MQPVLKSTVIGYVLMQDGKYICSNGKRSKNLANAAVMSPQDYQSTRKVFNEKTGYQWVKVNTVTTVQVVG